MKDTVTLQRKLPAIFTLTEPNVMIKVTSTAPNSTPLAASLSPQIEIMLQQSDHRITTSSANPQTLIDCNISAYVPPSIHKVVNGSAVHTKTGTIPAHEYQRVSGDLIVSYRAITLRTGTVLDAKVLEAKVNKDYEVGGEQSKSPWGSLGSIKDQFKKDHKAEETVPGVDQVNLNMVRDIASQLAGRVVNTNEAIQVLLSKGKFEQASKLGASGNWAGMLNALNGMAPLPDKAKDSYRAYDIGVAYEAMGYAAPDTEQAIKMFELAATNYGTAIEDNGAEKYFLEPQMRIQTALVTEKTRDERAKNGGQPSGTDLAETTSAGGSVTPTKVLDSKQVSAKLPDPPPSNYLDNAAVIGLVGKGLDDDNLIATIQDAPKATFNLSPQGLSQLVDAKVSNKVIAAMRVKNRSSQTATSHRQTASSAKSVPSSHP